MGGGSKVTTRNAAKADDATEPPSLQSIDEKLNTILGLLEKNTNDIAEIKKEQKDMCTSIEQCHAEISNMKQLVSTQDKKIVVCESEFQRVTQDNVSLTKQLKKLETEIRDLEQYSHRNNLIVYGVPEDVNENILGVMRRLATALQFQDWSASLVDAVHRMGQSSDSKPRPIIIKFVSRLDKEEFLRKRRVQRNLKAQDLGFASEQTIYITESLTPANRNLLRLAREAAKERNYAHVWTVNCSIYVRKEKGSPAMRIATARDLKRM